MIDPTAGAGAMADRVRAFRWDDTPLGPLGAWPASLRSAVALVLESRVPMALWWGESLTAIYNDACVPLLAGRHPAAFGRAAAEGWHDVWHVLGPQARRVLDGGGATLQEHLWSATDPAGVAEETCVTFACSPARDDAGAIGGVLVICQETAAGDRAVRLAREHIHAIFDQAPALIAVFRGPTHVVELANRDICRAWGRTVDDVRGRPFFDAVPEGRDQTWRALLDGVYRTGEPFLGREVAAQFDRSGTGRLETGYYDFVWAPLREHGQVCGIINVATDVTEQVLARRELSSLREAAEAANRAKDEFMAMLGHELRNPLAPILTALQLLKLRGVEAAERERAIIERQVRHVVTLVDDLLDVSRITRGKIQVRRTFVELAEVVAKAIEMASPLLEQQRHELRVEVARVGLGVLGDPARLAQVVANLLTNAAKYTESGGLVHVSAHRDDGDVVLHVRDTGVGIAPEMLPRVFELFVQEGQSLARSRGGLGLGLTIVRSLVSLHGGTVTAHSEGGGRGSTFTIRLPYVPASGGHGIDTASGDRERDLPAVRPRVLVVDDNVDAAALLADTLVDFGCTTRAVYDGPAALEAALAFRPDVALLDIGLPVMDGYELARRLAAHPQLTGVRLVAVTGYGQPEDRERTRAAGFHAHLVKPVDLGDLRDTLVQLVGPEVGSRFDR